MRTIKEGCLDQMIFFGEESLRQAIHEFVIHYHRERNHQGLENRLITPMEKGVDAAATLEQHQRLGGLLNYHHRTAA